MNRHRVVLGILLGVVTGHIVFAAASAPQLKTRTLAPLAGASYLQVPSVRGGSVAGVSQLQPLPALATKTPRVGPQASPGPLAVPLLALPENSGESILEPQKPRSAQISEMDIPALDLSGAPGEPAAEPLQARKQRVPAKRQLEAHRQPARKSVLPALSLAPKDLAALKDIEKPELALSSQMTKVLTFADLSRALELQTTNLCGAIQQRTVGKKAAESLRVSAQAQQSEQRSSLQHIIHTSSELVQILQQIAERQLTLAESTTMPRLRGCVESLRTIIDETEEKYKNFISMIKRLDAKRFAIIQKAASADLTSGSEETKQIKQLYADREDVYVAKTRLVLLSERMKALLSKIGEEHEIIGAQVTEEA